MFREIVDQIKARHALDTDYQAYKILDISKSRFYSLLERNGTPEDDVILTAEKLLDMPEGALLFEAHATRTKCKKAAELFHKISQQLTATAASILLAVSMTYSSFSGEALASPAPLLSLVQCILC